MVITHHSSAAFEMERSNYYNISPELVQYWLAAWGRDEGLAVEPQKKKSSCSEELLPWLVGCSVGMLARSRKRTR